MNKIQNNFYKQKFIEYCICGIKLTNIHLFTCTILNNVNSPKTSYTQIFNGSLSEQKEINNILNQNMEKIEAYTRAQVDPWSR